MKVYRLDIVNEDWAITAIVASGCEETALVTFGIEAHLFGIDLVNTPLLNEDSEISCVEIDKLHYDSDKAKVLYASLD